jgi:hypothetical protein
VTNAPSARHSTIRDPKVSVLRGDVFHFTQLVYDIDQPREPGRVAAIRDQMHAHPGLHRRYLVQGTLVG